MLTVFLVIGTTVLCAFLGFFLALVIDNIDPSFKYQGMLIGAIIGLFISGAIVLSSRGLDGGKSSNDSEDQ